MTAQSPERLNHVYEQVLGHPDWQAMGAMGKSSIMKFHHWLSLKWQIEDDASMAFRLARLKVGADGGDKQAAWIRANMAFAVDRRDTKAVEPALLEMRERFFNAQTKLLNASDMALSQYGPDDEDLD